MPIVRVKASTKERVEQLARKLVSAPGVERSKYAGADRVSADEVIQRALELLERETNESKS